MFKLINGSKKKEVLCQELGISRRTFYNWKKKYESEGIKGLIRKKPIAYHHPNRLTQEIVERILELRETYKLGPKRIMWYLERYHDIKISESSVSRTLEKPLFCRRQNLKVSLIV